VAFKGFIILFFQDIQKHYEKESDPEGYDIITVSIRVTFEGLNHYCFITVTLLLEICFSYQSDVNFTHTMACI